MFKLDELVRVAGARLISAGQTKEISGVSIDTRTVGRQEAFLAIKGNAHDGHLFVRQAVDKGASCLIIQRDSLGNEEVNELKDKAALIEVPDTVKALGELAAMHRRKFDIPIVAVSGSNGKTTTKDMIACLLGSSLRVLKNEGTKNNHIGVPLTLLKLNESHQAAVIETGSNHFGEIAYLAGICQPSIGVITNVGPSHLEHFGTIEGVLKEKFSLIENLSKPACAVLNGDDPYLKIKQSEGYQPFTLTFGINNRSDFTATALKIYPESVLFKVNQKCRLILKAPGFHNIYNALAAVSVARLLGVDYRRIRRALSGFALPSGRLNIKNINKVKFIDDSYNSNPLSFSQAMESLSRINTRGRKICVMGDMLELGDRNREFHQEAGRMASKVCDVLVTVGELSRFAAEAALAFGFNSGNVFICTNPKEARQVLAAKVGLGPHDVVLVKGSRSMKMEEVMLAPAQEHPAELDNQACGVSQ